MPSKTFLNLPKEKKVRFIKASLIEFSNYPLKDASINRIIKSCDIARGSFYQYFKDINDLYLYIFDMFLSPVVYFPIIPFFDYFCQYIF